MVHVMCKQGNRKSRKKGMEMKKDDSDLRGVKKLVRGGFMYLYV